MGWLDRIAERMMLKARAEGKLSGLEGEGRPLPERPVEQDATAAGFRIMGQAGVLPEEIVLKKQVIAAQERLARLNPPVDGVAGRGMIAVSAPGASFALPIGDVIDVAAETARLQKQLGKGEKDAEGLAKRLGNPKFVENAEPEVIEETQAKLAGLQDDLARLRAALAQLAAM